MKKVIIIGSGGHAKVCIEMLKKSSEYTVVGLLDDFKANGEKTNDIPVIGKVEDAEKYKADHSFFIAVGYNYARYAIAYKLIAYQLDYINIVDPSVVVSIDLSNSKGVAIMPGAIVNAGTYLGDHVIVNTGATIDHDNILSDYVSIGPGVHTGGNVHIGRCSHVGIGSVIKNTVVIGEYTVIGAGSLVLKFISSNKTAYGSPCEEIRNRAKSDNYL